MKRLCRCLDVDMTKRTRKAGPPEEISLTWKKPLEAELKFTVYVPSHSFAQFLIE